MLTNKKYMKGVFKTFISIRLITAVDSYVQGQGLLIIKRRFFFHFSLLADSILWLSTIISAHIFPITSDGKC